MSSRDKPVNWRRWLPIFTVPFLVGLTEVFAGFAAGTVWFHLILSAGTGCLVVAISPRKGCCFAAVLSLMSASFVISAAFIHEMHQDEQRAGSNRQQGSSGEAEAPDAAGSRAAPAASGGFFSWIGFGSQAPGEVVPMETMSVVLPCAFEGKFAEQTVRAIVENTRKERLHEIIVVDDGSYPPLSKFFPKDLLKPQGLVLLMRHERTEGLISAKKTGGDAATADIIVFFDCHVSPRKGWEEAMRRQMLRAGDHRTVVVPTISSLDPDTWKEIPNGPSSSACYILPNADFTWLANSGRDVPLMSGGLLAISRKWWQETGGYDEHMVAWGGENIDQSLRSWLCGGRIEAAKGAVVAHMWRDPKKPKTMLRYPIPTADVMRNKARAVTAWFDGFKEKVFTYPEYEDFLQGRNSIGDMSNFDSLKSNLQCAPFASYVQRFSYVYLDGGLIPQDVYQLREESTGFCLERVPAPSSPHHTALVPCASEHDGGGGPGSISELQLWHLGNRNRYTKGGCCSGIMQWNFLLCLDAQGMGSRLSAYECSIDGRSLNQYLQLSDEGQLVYRSGDGAIKGKLRGGGGGGGCIIPETPSKGQAKYVGLHDCGTLVEPVESGSFFQRNLVHTHDGKTAPKSFRLHSKHDGGACAMATGAATGDGPGWKLGFQVCDSADTQQVFHVTPMHDGLQVHVGDTNMCLDAGGGVNILVYPCYQESANNKNQIWQLQNDHLVWQGPQEAHARCLDFQANPKLVQGKGPTPVVLRTCSSKKGQRIEKAEQNAESGTFLLRDKDSGKCVGSDPGGNGVVLNDCEYGHRWKARGNKLQLVSGACIDAVDYQTPKIFSCHGGRTQWWAVDDANGWVKVLHAWEDNGRRRFFERCLDSEPAPPLEVSVGHCDGAISRGVKWTRQNVRTPLEAQIWQKAEKPKYGELPLGGSAEPPSF
mmetsp:Transcript_147574/g.269124  ORF Transcript_147574/g.269124 Transcript_147574/m.269124 type:complete len:932 (-) Transcript_147574:26-2821(-)